MSTPEPLTTEHVDVVGHPIAVEAPQARPASTWQWASVAIDAAMLAAAAFVAQLGAQQAGVSDTPLVWLVLFGALVVGISYFRGGYEWRVRVQPIDDCWAVVTTTALAAMVVLSARVLFGQEAGAADELLRLWAFSAIYVGGGRVAL